MVRRKKEIFFFQVQLEFETLVVPKTDGRTLNNEFIFQCVQNIIDNLQLTPKTDGRTLKNKICFSSVPKIKKLKLTSKTDGRTLKNYFFRASRTKDWLTNPEYIFFFSEAIIEKKLSVLQRLMVRR